jgi:hypothetical protein
VPNVLFCLFAISYTCHVLDVSAWRYLRTSWLGPLAATVLPVILWWIVTPVEATWSALALGIGAGLVPYVLVVVGIELAPRLANRFSTFRLATRRVSTQSAR